MTRSSSLAFLLSAAAAAAATLPLSGAFVVAPRPSSFGACSTSTSTTTTTSTTLGMGFEVTDELFEDEEDMIDVAANFIHAKYKLCATEHGHDYMTQDDTRDVLRSILPPVTPEELDSEVQKTLALIMKNTENTPDKINENCFVDAVLQNSYWQTAGGLVVKELMYFDALYHYYRTGTSLLGDEDYENLKENLTWEGSSIASLSKDEAMFVNAVASARRGEAFMDDGEYRELKDALKKKGSWVTDRKEDALEKMGLNTFMGYLHRAL